MSNLNVQVPVLNQPNSTEDPKIITTFNNLSSWANGLIDANNMSPAGAQAFGANQIGQTVKGAVNIGASESRSNTAYGTLTTPDQVTGIMLGTNGLIRVWYQATWQCSVAGAARAAIFLGSNQIKSANDGTFGVANPATQAGAMANTAGSNTNTPLVSASFGLAGVVQSSAYAGDVATGQVVALTTTPTQELSGTILQFSGVASVGGPCDIFAAAGTYTVSVQFKATSGSVTASNRKLWVQAISFT